MSVIVKSNPNTTEDVVIGDVGIIIPKAGGTSEFSDKSEILEIANSTDVVTLATDNAYDPEGSTLIINNGVQDIPETVVASFLMNLHVCPDCDAFGVPLRDAVGDTVVTEYINGLLTRWASLSTIQIEAGVCRNDVDDGNIRLTALTTVNINSSGANGLDTGTKEDNTWYYVWVIKNPVTNAVAGLLSKSITTPTLPSGYTKKRRVGTVRTNGSSNIVPIIVGGVGNNLVFHYDNSPFVLFAGHDTDWTDIDLSSAIPPIGMYTFCSIEVAGVWNSNEILVTLRGKGSGADQRYVTGYDQFTNELEMWSGIDQIIQYKVNDALASVYIRVYGWLETI